MYLACSRSGSFLAFHFYGMFYQEQTPTFFHIFDIHIFMHVLYVLCSDKKQGKLTSNLQLEQNLFLLDFCSRTFRKKMSEIDMSRHVSTCLDMSGYVDISICIYLSIHRYIDMSMSRYLAIYIHLFTHIYIYIYMYMYIYICIYMYIYIYIYVYIYDIS